MPAGVIDQANRVLFVKGVPKEADPGEVGHITGSVFSGNVLTLTIESGAYTRAMMHSSVQKTGRTGTRKHRLGSVRSW